MTWRGAVYVLVGTTGFAVQLGALALLMAIGCPFLVATALAVELSVIYNFFCHERWTWSDRIAGRDAFLRRFVRYNATTGSTSIAGNVVFAALYAQLLGVSPVTANALAVVSLSVANFLIADRWVFTASAICVAATVCAAPASAAELRPETISAWNDYVRRLETRIQRDALTVPAATESTPIGETIDVPAGLIHHWRGSVFVPRVTLDALLRALMSPAPKPLQEDVLESRILSRDADSLRVRLRIARKTIVTVVYDTDHEMTFRRRSADVATSRSVATRIVEIADAGTREEHERPAGDDRGFLWRLNSYWRYVQEEGGVRVELESATLSRDIPPLVRPIAAPIVAHISRESMARTLAAFATRMSARN